MLQLVGQTCVRCQRPIASIVEGDFCASCLCPVHHRCRTVRIEQPGACATCGADSKSATDHQKRLHAELVTESTDLRSYHFTTGVARIVAGLFCLFVVIPVLVVFVRFVAGYVAITLMLPAGSALLLNGVRQLKLLKKGGQQMGVESASQPWAERVIEQQFIETDVRFTEQSE